MATQAKLLSVIQTREVVPVGSNKPVGTDIRLLCATNSNLEEKIRNGTFREDLFYRINTVTINIPPLRERQEDIIPLAEYYLEQFSRKYNKQGMILEPDTRERLEQYTWKGNVRELRHTIERAVILTDSGSISTSDLQLSSPAELANSHYDVSTLEEMERQAIIRAIRIQKGNITLVAASLGITRQTLYNKMKKYGL